MIAPTAVCACASPSRTANASSLCSFLRHFLVVVARAFLRAETEHCTDRPSCQHAGTGDKRMRWHTRRRALSKALLRTTDTWCACTRSQPVLLQAARCNTQSPGRVTHSAGLTAAPHGLKRWRLLPCALYPGHSRSPSSATRTTGATAQLQRHTPPAASSAFVDASPPHAAAQQPAVRLLTASCCTCARLRASAPESSPGCCARRQSSCVCVWGGGGAVHAPPSRVA
jgi:hypothetical protein